MRLRLRPACSYGTLLLEADCSAALATRSSPDRDGLGRHARAGGGDVATPARSGSSRCATLRADEAERAIVRVKELTDRPFGVNFLMEQPGAAADRRGDHPPPGAGGELQPRAEPRVRPSA